MKENIIMENTLTLDMFKKEPIESDYDFINFYNENMKIFENIKKYNKKIDRYYHADPFNKKMDLISKMISSITFNDKCYKYEDIDKCLTITQEIIDYISLNDDIYVSIGPVINLNDKQILTQTMKIDEIDIDLFKKVFEQNFSNKENQKYIFYIFTINEKESTVDIRFTKI